MSRIPLPPELRRAAIHTSTAADHGITRSRLRGPDVQHPFRGVASVDLDPADLRDRCTAFLPALEGGQVFSHTTALALHGAPLPELDERLHVSVVFPRTPPRRPGIHGHSLKDAPTMLLDAMPVAPPVDAWAQSAAMLGRADLTAVGDHLLATGTPGLVLAAIASTWRGRPGGGRLAWAAGRVRPGVRSRPETHLRLLLVRSRLPEPRVAWPVHVGGGLVLHPDLAYPERRLALEYEGDGHRSRRQWEIDIERRELLAEARWRTVRVTSAMLYRNPRGLVARVRRHLAA